MNQTDEPMSPAAQRLPEGIPLIYADQVMDVIYGLHTSKLILGVETGVSIRSVQTVVLPTAALLFMVHNVARNFASPSIVEETAHRLGNYVEALRSAALAQANVGDGDRDESGK